MSTEMKESHYQLAQPVIVQGHGFPDVSKGDGGADSHLIPGQKQGHKCCGGCCDVRRAVIVVNLVSIGLLLFGLVGMIVVKKNVSAMEFTDDATKTAMEEFAALPLAPLIAGFVVPIVMDAVGLAGAIIYNKWMVGVAGVFYCVLIVFDLLQLNVPGVIYNAFFAYPHFFLIKEINMGIMTKENYPNEKFSCCCV